MKTALCIILSGISLLVHGQNILNYQFSATSGTYTPLTGGTTMPLSGGNTDDGWFNTIPIGFTFYYMGVPATTISASTKGWITFDKIITNAAYSNLLASGGTRPLLAPLWDDHNLVAAANFSFQTSGSAPERVFTAQWSNVEWKNTASSAGISFQLKLYEMNGKIEFIYHPEAGSLSSPSASIGITATGTGAGNFLSLSDASTSPAVSSTTEVTTIATKPADGQIYSFSPPSSSPLSPGSIVFSDLTKTSMTVSWTDQSTTETWFDLLYSQDGVNYLLLERMASSSMAATGTVYSRSHTGLLPGITYHYRIIAWNEGNPPSSPLSGSQATLSPTEITSVKDGNWSATSTWSGGTVPTSLDNVTISNGDTVVIDAVAECNAITVGQGTATLLRFGTSAQTMTVVQGVTVAMNGIFAAGLTGGTNLSHNLRIGGASATATGIGSLTVNGVFDMYIGSSNGKASVTFYGNQAATVSGTGTIDFYRVILNKGDVTASAIVIPPVLELLVPCLGSGVAEAGFLYTHTAGLMKIGGNSTFSSKIFSSASYTTTALGGLWVSNPNFTLIGQAGNQTYNGLFRLTNGTCNFGAASGNALNTAAGATILIEGGTLNIAGRYNTGNAVNWIQTGGTVNVCTIGNTTANTAGFGLTSASASFTMSGGVLCLVKPNSNTTPASRLDYFNNAGILNITGGAMKLGNSESGSTRLFIIKGNAPSMEMTNDGGNSSANLSANLTVYGNLDIYGTGTFNNSTFSLFMAGMNASAPGHITVHPGATFTMNSGTSPALIFNSNSGNQTFTNNGILTDNQLTVLTVNNTFGGGGTVTVPSGLTIKGDGTLNLLSGTLQTGSGITAGSGGTAGFTIVRTNGQINGPVTHNHGSGVVNVTYNGTAAQMTGSELPPAISGTLLVNNPGGITLNSAVATSKLTMTSGNINSSATNLLTISGTGASDLVYSAGQINGPLARTLPASLASGTTWLFPLGKSLYRPAELINPVTTAGGTVNILAEVFDENSGGTAGSTMVSLNTDRYWSIQVPAGSANLTGASIRLTETGLTINNGIAKSASKTGVYQLACTNGPAGNTLTTDILSNLGFFVIGNKKMNYVSSTATQSNVTYVREGSVDQVIIGIQVVTTGNLEPAQLTSFTFNTNGTTRPADIASAKVYYTGTSGTFASTNLFGTIPTPSGSFVLNGSQTLAEGINYFWLTYDIVVGVVDNDLLDAECHSVTVRGVNYAPSVTAPAGSRTVREALIGTVTVGTTGTYPSLTGTGGLFEKAGLVGLKGNVNVLINTDIVESGANALTQWIEVGGTGFRLTIRPGDPTLKTLSGNYAGGLVRLSKVNRVLLDGRYNGAGKYLSIANTAPTGTIAAMQLIGTTAGQGCTFITLRNCYFSAGHNGSNSYALCAGGSNPGNTGYDHDSVSVIQCVVSRAQNGIFFSAQPTASFNDLVIQEDSVGSMTTGMEITKQGIYVLNCPGVKIHANKIFNIVSTNSEARGIVLGAGSINSSLSSNNINGVRYTGTGIYSICGIQLTPGFTTVNVSVYNNIITDVTGTGSSNLASYGIAGIRVDNGTGFNIHYNSINLFGNLSHATSGDISAALYINAQGGIVLTNNILKNSLVNTAASAYAYAIYSNMARSGFTQIDYNDYFGTGSQGRLGFCDYSVATTINAWRVITLQDVHSSGEDPVFASNTNLRIDLSSPARNAGIPVAGIQTDFENVYRNATNPCMGAIETTGDYRGPFINYTSLKNTSIMTDRTLTVSLTDSTGVPTSGSGLPVLYWNKNRGPWTAFTGIHQGGDQYQFTFGGGVVLGDSVFYYIAAQDTQTPPNVSVSPAMGASGETYNPPAYTTPPSTPLAYKILKGLNGTITVGTSGDYPNLTGTNGLFADINQNLLTGDVEATIISDITEPGTIFLNKWNEEGSGNYQLDIGPDGTTERILSGSAATGLIVLNGARWVTINGGSGDTITRYLRIRNTLASNPAIRLQNGAQYNTIRNCHIESVYCGIYFGTSTVFNGNSWNTIAYNDIHQPVTGTVPLYGIYSSGTTNNPNKNNTIKANNIYNFTSIGIFVTANGNGGEWIITKNSIYDLQSPAATSLQRGISFVAGYLSFDNYITENFIGGQGPQCSGLPWNNEGSNDVYGIYFKGGWASNYINNNTIKNIHLSSGLAGSFYGLVVQECQSYVTGNTIGDPDVYNSIRSATANGSLEGIRIQAPSSTCNVDGNRIYNLAFTAYSGYPDATGIFSDNAHVNNNLMFGVGYCLQSPITPYIVGIYLNTSAGYLNEVINNSVSLNGGYAADPSIYGIYEYGSWEDFFICYHNSLSINNFPETPPPSSTFRTPGIYYNETVALGRDSYAYFEMFNNVLVNTRSSESAGNNYAFTYLDTTNLSSDFNDFYVLNDSLGIISGIFMDNLAEWQAYSGRDQYSISQDPLFLNPSNDLHPLPESPLQLAGTGIELVDEDLEGNPRDPVSPTIGCYESPYLPDKTWNGTISADWENGQNWTPSGIPGINDDLLIPSGTPYSCRINTSGKLCNHLVIGAGATLTIQISGQIAVFGNLTIQPAATLTNNGSMTLKKNLVNQQ